MTAKTEYELIIVGAGPAGYQAAIRAGQLGMRTALIEARATLGGTCLNVGCIPSKHLLHVSQAYYEAKTQWPSFGLSAKSFAVDIAKLQQSKQQVVTNLCKGIELLIKKNKVDRFQGTASLIGNNKDKDKTKVKVTGTGDDVILTADRIILATGSEVINLPGVKIDEKKILSSTGALEISSIPKKMLVIGAGVIGLELGSVWSRFGTEVTFVEALPQILAGSDTGMAKQLQQILQRQGLKFLLQQRVAEITTNKKGVAVKLESGEQLAADQVLVAVGRRANTAGLRLDEVGVELDSTGRIKVDAQLQTSVAGIYAVGDAIAGPMLAHKAGDEAIGLVDSWQGHSATLDYNLVPGVVYTTPEYASIGKTEQQLTDQGISFRSGSFPFMANSRARTTQHTAGMVKLLADQAGTVLGGHIIGPEAGNMIHELAVLLEYRGNVTDLALINHAHPTYNEAIKEAALALLGRVLHI